jgi:cytochrome P450
VRAEIDALGPDPDPDALASLPFLSAACHEALRQSAPVVDAARITRRPFELAGYTIPAGEAIRPSLSLLHARADLYPEPDRFRPERFLERQFSPFEFIPFGGGARRCLGAAFALHEMKVVLGTLLRGRRLRLADAAPVEEVRRGLLMGPRGGVPMMVEVSS